MKILTLNMRFKQTRNVSLHKTIPLRAEADKGTKPD